MNPTQFDILCAHLNDVKDNVALLSKLITGNGEPEKGVLVRLDRVEVKIKSATWFVRAAIVAAITAIGGLAVEIAIKILP